MVSGGLVALGCWRPPPALARPFTRMSSSTRIGLELLGPPQGQISLLRR
jgi:hypothetical protein